MSEFRSNDEPNTNPYTDDPIIKGENVFEGSGDNSEKESVPTNIKRNKVSFLSELVDYAEVIAVALLVVVLMFSFVFRICTVDGDSMNNTLLNKENLVVTDLFYTPKYGDIIVFHDTGVLGKPLVKRVIATEGQTVTITYMSDTMKVEVTDDSGDITVLDEEYILYEYQRYVGTHTYTVPDGCLFVMGDNRNNSKDSRDPDIEFVDTRSVLGKVVFRISPFKKIGFVN